MQMLFGNVVIRAIDPALEQPCYMLSDNLPGIQPG